MATVTSTIVMALVILILLFLLCFHSISAQQQYTGNDMLDCYNKRNTSSVLGYVCGNGGGAAASCLSYLYFRSNPSYDTPVQIAYLLSADVQNITSLNNITDVSKLPDGRPVLVPVTCSCNVPSTGGGHGYYQHDASYGIKWTNETYQVMANNTYQGLTTCQAMMAQNPYDSYHLLVKERLKAPLRCACPTAAQLSAGYRYLVTYPITWGNNIPFIAGLFQTDEEAVLLANGIPTNTTTIFPFSTLLVPVREQPTSDLIARLPGPSSPVPTNVPPPVPPTIESPSSGESGKGKKWVGVGVGAGAFLLLLCACGVVIWRLTSRQKRISQMDPYGPKAGSIGGREGVKAQRSGDESSILESYGTETGHMSPYVSTALTFSSTTQSTAAMSEEARLLTAGALVIYKYSDLQKATGSFGESHRISGSVYRGVINGDIAAVKRMKGDVSGEVAILKRFNHSSLVRLSGFCVHAGDTYLVFEYAKHGSLSDWLHSGNGDLQRPMLSWKRRVQVAYDIAEGLNYLHNYAFPACVHKDLRSSNVLLDGEFRAKLSNFGLARSLPEDHDGGRPMQMTRHVVGTQGYMPPEYLEHGLISPKMDIFAFGVVLLELLSGRDAVTEAEDPEGGKKGDGGAAVSLLWEEIEPVLAAGEDVRERISEYIDPRLQRDQYSFEAAFAIAHLARRCVARDAAARPTASEAFVALSAVFTSTLDWEPSSGSDGPDTMVYGR